MHKYGFSHLPNAWKPKAALGELHQGKQCKDIALLGTGFIFPSVVVNCKKNAVKSIRRTFFFAAPCCEMPCSKWFLSSESGSFLNAEGHFWDFVLTSFYIVFIWNRQKKYPQCFAKYFWKEQALWIIIFMFYLLLGVFRLWENLLSPEKGFERWTLR